MKMAFLLIQVKQQILSFSVFGVLFWGACFYCCGSSMKTEHTYMHNFAIRLVKTTAPVKPSMGPKAPPEALIRPYPELSIQHQGGP